MTAPLPRWVVLPGDPKPLKTWLAGQQAQASPETALPEDWPEDSR
jgi:hypothetical protein